MEQNNHFRIGLSGCGGGLEARSGSDLLEMAEVVEKLGFDALWFNEEHFEGLSWADSFHGGLDPEIDAD